MEKLKSNPFLLPVAKPKNLRLVATEPTIERNIEVKKVGTLRHRTVGKVSGKKKYVSIRTAMIATAVLIVTFADFKMSSGEQAVFLTMLFTLSLIFWLYRRKRQRDLRPQIHGFPLANLGKVSVKRKGRIVFQIRFFLAKLIAPKGFVRIIERGAR